MKPVAAIVGAAAYNEDLAAETIFVAKSDLVRAERSIERIRGQLDSAVGTAKMRRIEIGRVLSQIRPKWPERGPNAKGWSAFLARVEIDDSTAHRYMEEFRDPVAFSQRNRAKSSDDEDIDRGDDPVRDSDRDVKPANISGGSGEVDRGTFCTSKLWADRVGPWDLDPFSNPRSHIVAERRCMLEDGGDGLLDPDVPGSYSAPPKFGRADESTRVWIQPPYSILERVIAHYGHTRFCALLRLDSSTEWFAALWERTQVIALAKGTREFFEAPPGVEVSTNPQPHALYYADPRDVTPAIYEACIVLTRYQAAAQPALQIVR